MKQLKKKTLSSARKYAFFIPSIAPSSAMAVHITRPSHCPFSSQTDAQYQNQCQQPLGLDNTKHLTLTNNLLDEKFERRVEWILDRSPVPGLSIAVFTGNDTFLEVSFDLSQPLF